MPASRKYRAGPDVDLKREDVRDSKGRRITERYAEGAANYDPKTVRRGRRSLTGASKPSPRVDFRITDRVAAALDDVSRRTGKSRSEIGREALERYLGDLGKTG